MTKLIRNFFLKMSNIKYIYSNKIDFMKNSVNMIIEILKINKKLNYKIYTPNI